MPVFTWCEQSSQKSVTETKITVPAPVCLSMTTDERKVSWHILLHSYIKTTLFLKTTSFLLQTSRFEKISNQYTTTGEIEVGSMTSEDDKRAKRWKLYLDRAGWLEGEGRKTGQRRGEVREEGGGLRQSSNTEGKARAFQKGDLTDWATKWLG